MPKRTRDQDEAAGLELSPIGEELVSKAVKVAKHHMYNELRTLNYEFSRLLQSSECLTTHWSTIDEGNLHTEISCKFRMDTTAEDEAVPEIVTTVHTKVPAELNAVMQELRALHNKLRELEEQWSAHKIPRAR